MGRRHQYRKRGQSLAKTEIRNEEGVSPEGYKEDVYYRSLSFGPELPINFK